VRKIKEFTYKFLINTYKKSFIKLGYVGSVIDLPSLRFLAGFSGCSATLELKYASSSLFGPAVKNLGQSIYIGPSNIA